ncbi:MAG: beta-ketoacyl synthase N-terminal-like domain-containing protein [Acidiferrobacterales bacterium]
MFSTSIEPVVITGIGPICPVANTAAALSAAAVNDGILAAGHEGVWFQPENYFGPRGFKYFTLATRYILAATQTALKDASLSEDYYTSQEQGVIMGTNFSVYRTLEDMDQIVLANGSDGLAPMEAPNFSVNIPASTISIKHKFRAFNITLTNAMVSGLEAVWLGACAVREGRARMVIVGATEDVPHGDVEKEIGMPTADGSACAFVLETLSAARMRGARIYAQVGAGELCFFDPAWLNEDGMEQRLGIMLRRALDRLALEQNTVVHYSGLNCSYLLNSTVDEIVQQILSERMEVRAHQYLGASGGYLTVSPLFQLGATAMENNAGLMVATSPFGHIALLSIRPVEA